MAPSHSRSPSTCSTVDPFLTPPLATAHHFNAAHEFPFDLASPRSTPGTPLPAYSRHRPSPSSASFGSVSDALDFVEKFAPAPPTRRARGRYLLAGAVAGLVVLGLVAAGHSAGVVGRVTGSAVAQALTFGEGMEGGEGWGGWADWVKGEDDTAVQPIEVVEAFEVAVAAEPNPVIPEDGPIRVSALPQPRLPDLDDPDQKYLGFLPHSGFHNQRIALENALLLGVLLNRTVLVPPVWIGWPTVSKPYVRLQRAWTDALGLNPSSFGLGEDAADSPLSQPAAFASSVDDSTLAAELKADDELHEEMAARSQQRKEKTWAKFGWRVRPDGFPITNLTAGECKSYSVECRHTYKDTFLAWDFLAGLKGARSRVRMVDRWDIRERALLPLLNAEEKDFFVVEDVGRAYDLHLSDRGSFGQATSPLITPTPDAGKWHRTVSIGALNALPHKVLLMGSMFSSTKFDTGHPEADALRELFDQSLAFRNPWLIRPADEVAARLGADYLGVHARVGDGAFLRHAGENMEEAWKRLVNQMEVDHRVVRAVWDEVKPALAKRSTVVLEEALAPRAPEAGWNELDGLFEAESELYYFDETTGVKHRVHKRASVDDSAAAAASSPAAPGALRNLACRAPLHTAPELLPFNKPLYLATDSRNPTADPNLAVFFRAFPCTFVLNDFDRPTELNGGQVVESVQHMSRLENEADAMPLGRLFLPFLEAVIAAKARLTSGTPGSTFSGFAAGGMHRAYQADGARS